MLARATGTGRGSVVPVGRKGEVAASRMADEQETERKREGETKGQGKGRKNAFGLLDRSRWARKKARLAWWESWPRTGRTTRCRTTLPIL